jgi:hypothetical protein
MNNHQTHALVASVNRPFSQYYVSPDTFFTPKADACACSAHDVIDALLSQAHATVVALSADGQDLQEGFSLSQKIICNLLWSVQTQIEMAQVALQHMSEADRDTAAHHAGDVQ